MHGIIYVHLKRFIEEKLPTINWLQIVKLADVKSRIYLPVNDYPDEEMGAIMQILQKQMRRPFNSVLEQFGEFLGPQLAKSYKAFMHSDWKTLDIIENTEKVIYKALSLNANINLPKHPKMHARRIGSDEVHLNYSSSRKMCYLAKGIIRGLAKIYKEEIMITETKCMHKGSDHCHLIIKKN